MLAPTQVAHALPEDARAVADIHVNTWRTAYAEIVSAEYLAAQSIEHRQAWWSQCIAAGAPELLVAKENGVVQGWLNFGAARDEGAPASEAEIWAIYVAPAYWSTGTGRLLWLRARELMTAQGYRSCSLWVFPQNARAIRFYQAAGFSADLSPPKYFKLGGQQLQEVRYVCQLDG
jgi:ribosomal protein S18 acetylase RimI-like enzyme